MHFSTILSAFLGVSAASAFSIRAPYPAGASCDCNGEKIVDGGRNSSAYICRDGRLGPKILPKRLPLGTVISNYDRFGGLGPEEFLEKWTDENGTYVYPPQNGFVLDDQGKPISSNVTLPKGTLVDRFGSEYGKSKTTSPVAHNCARPNFFPPFFPPQAASSLPLWLPIRNGLFLPPT